HRRFSVKSNESQLRREIIEAVNLTKGGTDNPVIKRVVAIKEAMENHHGHRCTTTQPVKLTIPHNLAHHLG
ncbi:MAG TPA: hypothetical protein VIM69_05045, partial [Opitutaceae bacterium]